MPASLRLLTDEELSEFIEGMSRDTSKKELDRGSGPDVPRRIAREQSKALFPDGTPADGQLFFRVLDDDGAAVGTLWIGIQHADQPGAFWVWDVRIDEAHRGNGYGRAAMELAEAEARSRGASELGLNVFGHNQVARRLYESMGYTATAIRMKESL